MGRVREGRSWKSKWQNFLWRKRVWLLEQRRRKLVGIWKLHQKGGLVVVGRLAYHPFFWEEILSDLRIEERMVTWRGSTKRRNENHEENEGMKVGWEHLLFLLLVILIKCSNSDTLGGWRSSNSSIWKPCDGKEWGWFFVSNNRKEDVEVQEWTRSHSWSICFAVQIISMVSNPRGCDIDSFLFWKRINFSDFPSTDFDLSSFQFRLNFSLTSLHPYFLSVIAGPKYCCQNKRNREKKEKWEYFFDLNVGRKKTWETLALKKLRERREWEVYQESKMLDWCYKIFSSLFPCSSS